jgi:hypothetical protein
MVFALNSGMFEFNLFDFCCFSHEKKEGACSGTQDISTETKERKL